MSGISRSLRAKRCTHRMSRRTHRMSTCDDGRAHVLETILADVELGEAGVLLGVGGGVPRVHLVAPHLYLLDAVLLGVAKCVVKVHLILLQATTITGQDIRKSAHKLNIYIYILYSERTQHSNDPNFFIFNYLNLFNYLS